MKTILLLALCLCSGCINPELVKELAKDNASFEGQFNGWGSSVYFKREMPSANNPPLQSVSGIRRVPTRTYAPIPDQSQIDDLQERLNIISKERDALRELYTKPPQPPQ